MRDPLPMRFDERRLRQAVVVPAPANGKSASHAGTTVTPRAETDGWEVSVGAAETERTHGTSRLVD